MEKQGKGRSRPMPDAGNIKTAAYNLEEALSTETQYICDYNERTSWEVGCSARDASVHLLRMLKVWFDLPETVYFTSVSYLDMFLTRMKVQEKYLSCVSISCFNLAATKQGFKINPSQLVNLSQSKCSVQDMERMSSIITKKLGRLTDSPNVLDFLKIYLAIFTSIAAQFNTNMPRFLKFKKLYLRLEYLMCNSETATYKPSVIALAFLHSEMEHVLRGKKKMTQKFYMLAVLIELRSLCKVKSNDYITCYKSVSKALDAYDSEAKLQPHLKTNWRFSQSTYALAKSLSNNYYCSLGTIKEE